MHLFLYHYLLILSLYFSTNVKTEVFQKQGLERVLIANKQHLLRVSQARLTFSLAKLQPGHTSGKQRLSIRNTKPWQS